MHALEALDEGAGEPVDQLDISRGTGDQVGTQRIEHANLGSSLLCEHRQEPGLELRFSKKAEGAGRLDPVANFLQAAGTGLALGAKRQGTGRAQTKGLLKILVGVVKDEKALILIG